MGGAKGKAAGLCPSPASRPQQHRAGMPQRSCLDSDTTEAQEGRLMGSGTALLLAIVAPVPGMGCMLNK